MADTESCGDAGGPRRYQVGHLVQEDRRKNQQVEPDTHQRQVLLEYQDLGGGKK